MRLGHPGAVAGVPRRPTIPCQEATIIAVRQYLIGLHGANSLHNPIHLADIQPTLQFTHIDELTVQQRFNNYAQFLKFRRGHRS